MSIKESLEKIKPFYPVFLIVAVSVVFFYLGRISAIKSENRGVSVQYPAIVQTANVINITESGTSTKEVVTPLAPSGAVVGSKSGKKYYFPWCGTVKRIKPENQVHFVSIEAAKSAGFTPGGNCKGIY